MPVEYQTGDLFSSDADALAHGCNCQGVMGAGIAVQFKKRDPEMFRQYANACVMNKLKPGDVFTWSLPFTRPVVFNLMTQPTPGPTAKLEHLRESLTIAITEAEILKLKTIALPRVGCGLGGLNWLDVKAVIEELGSNTSIRLIIYSL